MLSLHRLATALFLLAPMAQAQLDLERVGGVLGESVQFDLAGTGALAALVVSGNSGPTPLALVDPGDPRQLDVGLDLLEFLTIAALPASQGFPLPADASLQGVPIYGQAVSLPGAASVFDAISNAVAWNLASGGTSEPTLGARVAPIDGHTATVLEDGRVVLIGGVDVNTGQALGLIEIFDPQTQSFVVSAASLATPRSAHTATRLPDGRVLILGGTDTNEVILGSAELYDPLTDSISPAAPMSTPRVTHTATLAGDGRVFVAGGIFLIDPGDKFSALNNTLASSEVYDPVGDTWIAGPSFPTKLTGHAAATLGNGQVLVCGGIEVTSLFGLPLPTFSAAARRWNPATNAFSGSPAIPGARAFHSMIAAGDGSVLVVGGALQVVTSYSILGDCHRFTAGVWSSAGNLVQARAYPNLAFADSGELCVVSGLLAINATSGVGTPAQNIERSNAGITAWSTAGALTAMRLNAITVAVDGGERLLTTGAPAAGTADAEMFVP
ncbi:MAG: Kelch repeat-containing protein [Planctomycetota bacterium]|jgi:hypothetical protein